MALSRRAALCGGAMMPVMGVGTWRGEAGVVGRAVSDALMIGYRHIDCAAVYGNQREVGDAIRTSLRDGVVEGGRGDLFVTSKLWNTDHRPENVRPAAEHTLRQLGLDYLDLYLVHWPAAFRHTPLRGPDEARDFYPARPDGDELGVATDAVPLLDTWQAMQELVEAGLVRNVGLSNCSADEVRLCAAAGGPPVATNQVECHPNLQQWRLRRDLLAVGGDGGVPITAYTPLGQPAPGSPRAPPLFELPAIRGVAAELGCTPAQAALAWGLAAGNHVIPKASSAARLRENAAALCIRLDASLARRLNGMGRKPVRMVNPRKFRSMPGRAFFPPSVVEEHEIAPRPGSKAMMNPHSLHWSADVDHPERGDEHHAKVVAWVRKDVLTACGAGVESLFVSPTPNKFGTMHGRVSFKTGEACRAVMQRWADGKPTVMGKRELKFSTSRYSQVARSSIVRFRGLGRLMTENDLWHMASRRGAVLSSALYDDGVGSQTAHVRYRDPIVPRRVLGEPAEQVDELCGAYTVDVVRVENDEY